MKWGEQVTINRLSSGLYIISRQGQPDLVGGAASTAIALMAIVFQDEASEPTYLVEDK